MKLDILQALNEEREARRYVATRGLNGVEFLGRVSGDEKAQLYKTADVYASPATGGESFGIVLLLTSALVFGLRVDAVARGAGSLVSVLLSPSQPPPKPRPTPKPRPVEARSSAAKGDPSPRNLKNQATPVFAPKITPQIEPPPVVTATQPAQGNAAQTGASNLAGPGQGAGGVGNGNGGGGTGGDGDGDGIEHRLVFPLNR